MSLRRDVLQYVDDHLTAKLTLRHLAKVPVKPDAISPRNSVQRWHVDRCTSGSYA